jgi:hypothetical protein
MDWAQYYWWTHDEPELSITEARPYDYAQHYSYMRWYYKRVITTTWYEMNIEEQLNQPNTAPRGAYR